MRVLGYISLLVAAVALGLSVVALLLARDRPAAEPLRALGIFAAHSIAASTDSTSIKK